jgi:hypothetical protein
MTGGYTAIVINLPDDDGLVRIEKRTCPPGDMASLNFLQGVVGGYIEHLATSDGATDFWMNEEGKLDGLPVNDVATDVLRLLYPWSREQVWPGGPGEPYLVGNVVLTGNNRAETASVPDGTWELLRGFRWVRQYHIQFVEEQKQ